VEEEENEYVVVAKGNTRTSIERVSDYAVLRAAQLMKEEGFEYFVVSKEIKDFTSTTILYGDVAIGVADSRNPITGLLITGYNEKPESEGKGKKQKVYETADVLKELGHYVNEPRPEEFNSGATAVAAISAVSILIPVGLIVWLMTL
jgi:hypothetical protein